MACGLFVSQSSVWWVLLFAFLSVFTVCSVFIILSFFFPRIGILLHLSSFLLLFSPKRLFHTPIRCVFLRLDLWLRKSYRNKYAPMVTAGQCFHLYTLAAVIFMCSLGTYQEGQEKGKNKRPMFGFGVRWACMSVRVRARMVCEWEGAERACFSPTLCLWHFCMLDCLEKGEHFQSSLSIGIFVKGSGNLHRN